MGYRGENGGWLQWSKILDPDAELEEVNSPTRPKP